MCFVAQASYYKTTKEVPSTSIIRRCAALNRINALACIMSARHGWIGASYSACEILTTLYFGQKRRNVILSKGHASALQYACLFGIGLIDEECLLSYKNGSSGLQAHTDLTTNGILVNTGSLGQALSKAAGLAFIEEDQHFDVIIGDGELQEGQCYEAFQTINHNNLNNLTLIVDENGYQSQQQVDDIKRIVSRQNMLSGFGFDVVCVDGHQPSELVEALDQSSDCPRAVLARTEKAGGSSALLAAGGPGVWHSRVPDETLALDVIDEQVELAAVEGLAADWDAYKKRRSPTRTSLKPHGKTSEKEGSTGQFFARALEEIALDDERVVVLDADLAEPCGIGGLEETLEEDRRFVELGISEQDMVSFAGGVARRGRVPVVNTYAAFYKRAFEQICVNGSEVEGNAGAIIYAGHYAGLGYYSDGKTHQSLNDLSMMRTVPGLVVVDPLDALQTRSLLRWAVGRRSGQTYFRLRRIGGGLDGDSRFAEAQARETERSIEGWLSRPLVINSRRKKRFFLTVGPLATRLALDATAHESMRDWGVVVQSVFGHLQDLPFMRELLENVDRVITVEDGNRSGGLWSFCCELLQCIGLGNVRVQALSVEGFGPSFRTYKSCCAAHGFVEHVARRIALDERSVSIC